MTFTLQLHAEDGGVLFPVVEGAAPVDLTGWTVQAQVRPSPSSATVLHEWSTALGNATAGPEGAALTWARAEVLAPAGCSCGDVIDNATATGWAASTVRRATLTPRRTLGSDAVTLTNLAAGGTSPVRRLRAASNGSLSWVEPLFVRKAADQQYLNTAALADVTNLGIDLEADSVYVGSAQITYSTGATSVKCNLGWTLPAGATMSWSANGISSAATTVAAAISRTNLNGAQSQNVGSAGASAIDALPTFIIMTGATAGRLQLQAAQGTADAVNALTIKANSWLRAERVV